MSAPARFEVVAGKASGSWIDVGDELLLGRHADGVGRLGDDDEMSRYHARLSLDAGGYCAIEDLGSTNGTFVNGLKITVPQTLTVGDTIELGGTTLVLRELPAPAVDEPASGTPAGSQREETAERAVPPAVVLTAEPLPEPPAPEPEPEPEPERVPEPEPALPPLSLRVEVDFAAKQATILLDDSAEPVRMVFESGAWRIAG